MRRPNDIGGSRAKAGPAGPNAREDIPEDFHDTPGCFEPWPQGLANLSAGKGFATHEETGRRMRFSRDGIG